MVRRSIRIQKKREWGDEIVMWSGYENEEMRDFRENMWIEFEYNGVRILCRLTFHPTTQLPVIWCRWEHRKLLPMVLYTSTCEVLMIQNTIQIKSSFSEFNNFPATLHVDNLVQWCSHYELNDFETFVRIINVNNVDIRYLEKVSPASAIFSIDHLTIRSPTWFTRDHLLNFSGKSAFIQDVRDINNQDLIDFIKKWKDGEDKKLESMIVVADSLTNLTFDLEAILREFETKPWDPKRRSGRFNFPENRMQFAHRMDIMECSENMDIERESDGLLATISVINQRWFCFFVWHNRFPDPGTNFPILNTPTNRPPYHLHGGIWF
ncbi:hypothetical protein CAEBREN_13042 [Caenorhabditis brenneri]|uniref:Sdz-33 F-box domain-containing protein n=1 Tax=Caenorhabditis brenneri TaxID=135651 RepID=G0P9W0_CAEBE|nr:hypothetical protein CAEBREN_13042 [Caenorhabditis brenneri]